MKWISVKDTSEVIPFTKVCVYDGNTWFGILLEIRISKLGRTHIWDILKPDGICSDQSEVTHWMEIPLPVFSSTSSNTGRGVTDDLV